jgi:F0F1-type ATP synthase assembly protein I
MVKRNEEEKESFSERQRASSALGFGSAFAGGMAVFSLGGHWLDVKFGKEPLFTLIGIALGFVFGGWELWKLVAESNRSVAQDDQKSASSEKEGGV